MYPNWLHSRLFNWSKFKPSLKFSFFDIMMYLYVLVTNMKKLSILEPEILGNHDINTGTTLLLKTIVN